MEQPRKEQHLASSTLPLAWERWQIAFPWLTPGQHLGRWKCRICAASQIGTPFGLGLAGGQRPMQQAHLREHEHSMKHRLAASPEEAAAGECRKLIGGKLAPSADAFQAVMNAICGGSDRKGLRTKVGTSFKVRRMIYCLGEGARFILMDDLASSDVISFSQDGRKLRLAVHFGCCSTDLRVRRFGLLGCLNAGEILQDVSAQAIAASFLQIIEDPPPPGRRPRAGHRQCASNTRTWWST